MADYSEFFLRLRQCSAGERAILRRNCGKMLKDADGKAVITFYRCLPFAVPTWHEDRWFAVGCFSCLWNDEQVGVPIEEIFGKMKDDSGSLEHRLAALLDMSWDADGFLLGKLCRMIKMSYAKGYVVDCEKLLGDLILWNMDTQRVQGKWARAMYMKNVNDKQEV